MAIPLFKRGDSLSASGTYTPGTGAPATLAGATVTSKLMDYAGTRYSFTVTVAPNELDYTLYMDADTTSKFSLGMAVVDLRIEWSASQIQHTTTREINILESITTK